MVGSWLYLAGAISYLVFDIPNGPTIGSGFSPKGPAQKSDIVREIRQFIIEMLWRRSVFGSREPERPDGSTLYSRPSPVMVTPLGKNALQSARVLLAHNDVTDITQAKLLQLDRYRLMEYTGERQLNGGTAALMRHVHLVVPRLHKFFRLCIYNEIKSKCGSAGGPKACSTLRLCRDTNLTHSLTWAAAPILPRPDRPVIPSQTSSCFHLPLQLHDKGLIIM